MSSTIKIVTPRGQIIKTENGSAQLTWNSGFGPKWTKQYTRAQEYVDSEVLRLDARFVPFQSGMLLKSGVFGTEVGSGLVQYIAPYAKKQYYNTADTRRYDTLRGGHWFERMKAEHGASIIAGAKTRAGEGKAT